MQFTTFVALFASLAIAAPASEVVERDGINGPCSAGVTNNVPKCCGAGILDLLYLDCQTRKSLTCFTEWAAISY